MCRTLRVPSSTPWGFSCLAGHQVLWWISHTTFDLLYTQNAGEPTNPPSQVLLLFKACMHKFCEAISAMSTMLYIHRTVIHWWCLLSKDMGAKLTSCSCVPFPSKMFKRWEVCSWECFCRCSLTTELLAQLDGAFSGFPADWSMGAGGCAVVPMCDQMLTLWLIIFMWGGVLIAVES